MSVDNSSEPWQKKLADIASAVSGGGGSSDFSTATVTFTNNSDIEFLVAVPYLYNEDEMDTLIPSDDMDGSDFEIVLYKGQSFGCICFLQEQNSEHIPSIAAIGDIDVINALLTFSGDGAVTFDNPNPID